MTNGTGWADTDLARLRLEGLDHLAHLLSGEATEKDAAELVAWRMQSRAHEEAFRAAVRFQRMVRVVDGAAGRGTPDASIGGPDNVVPVETAARRRVSRRGLLGGAIAASLAGGLYAAGRSFELVPSPAEFRADFRTGAGERSRVQLAGGASVELNTRTSVDLRKDLGMPAVELISGEAILNSGKAGAALAAGKGTTVARGGHFNARRDGDSVCITCLAGEAEVRWADQQRLLRPAEQVRYSDAAIEQVVRGVDAAALTAWQAGTLIFRNMPMRAVVDEINRYRPGHVFLANDALAQRPLTGTFYINRLDEFFNQAQLGLGVKVTHLPGNLTILS